MRLHYIQHNPFEDLANIALWAKESGHDISGTRIYAGEKLHVRADAERHHGDDRKKEDKPDEGAASGAE